MKLVLKNYDVVFKKWTKGNTRELIHKTELGGGGKEEALGLMGEEGGHTYDECTVGIMYTGNHHLYCEPLEPQYLN